MNTPSIHANCLIVGALGVLIRGPSGSGKSELCDHLIEAASTKGNFARLVCDDRVYLENIGGRLLATCPDEIFGQMEIRGFGLVTLPSERAARINLVVDLKPVAEMERLPEKSVNAVVLEDVRLPLIVCPANRPGTSRRLLKWASAQLYPNCPTYI